MGAPQVRVAKLERGFVQVEGKNLDGLRDGWLVGCLLGRREGWLVGCQQ